jgi:hypothetical protein
MGERVGKVRRSAAECDMMIEADSVEHKTLRDGGRKGCTLGQTIHKLREC